MSSLCKSSAYSGFEVAHDVYRDIVDRTSNRKIDLGILIIETCPKCHGLLLREISIRVRTDCICIDKLLVAVLRLLGHF